MFITTPLELQRARGEYGILVLLEVQWKRNRRKSLFYRNTTCELNARQEFILSIRIAILNPTVRSKACSPPSKD